MHRGRHGELSRITGSLLIASLLAGCGGSDSPTQPPPPAAAAAQVPAWVSSLSYWQWYAIPGTALSSVQPSPIPPGVSGPISKIDDWVGATLKRKGSVYIIGAAGGHADYAGNEVDALTLNTESPHWVELHAPTATSDIIDAAQYFLDLRPSPTHTYYAPQFINARNRMVILPSGAMDWAGGLPAQPSGWRYPRGGGWCYVFNMATNEWEAPEYVPEFISSPGFVNDPTAALVAKHPTTEDIYYNRYAQGFWKWTQATNTWSQISADNEAGNYAGAAIDPIRDRMLIVGSYSGTTLPRVRDLTFNLVSASFGGLGPSALQVGGYPGVVYDEANNKFLVIFNSGSGIRVYRVDPITWFVDEPATTGSRPADRTNGINGSCQYVPELGGIVIANSYSGDVYFMRTAP